MTTAQFRRSMAAGIAFVVLFVVGVFVTFGNSPDLKHKDSDAVAAHKYVAKLSDSGSRTGLLIGAYLIVLAALAFIWFTQGVRDRVASQPGGRLVGALGVLGAGAMAAGAMASAVVPGAVSFGDEPVPADGDTIRVAMDLFFPFLFVVLGLTAAALVAVVALRGEASLPSWLRYGGWLAVLGGIFAVLFLPMVLVLLWFLVFAILGLMSSRPERATPA
ncbi:MAG TPA: hypothetical protein VJ831_01000 [Jatrophihabitantaceae bacterium]|nr:hypothetical protein [Jatrophihabitantaceae bacterium]